jgi:hypothetical protein
MIVKSTKAVLLLAMVGVIARTFVGAFEIVVLLPLRIVFHIPLGTVYFGVITTDDSFIANSA